MAAIDDHAKTYADFKEAVNMTASALEKHLATDESKEVGWKGKDGKGDGESVGHKQGGLIVELLGKKKGDLSDDDYAEMKRVVGYVHRHMAEGGPKEDVEHSRWRYSLMNWGHDPLKK